MFVRTKIIGYDGKKLILLPEEPIDRTLLQKNADMAVVQICDGREISPLQRQKIYACIRDVASWSGHAPEELKEYLKFDFCKRDGQDIFSLSDVDMTTAREFISYLIDFCFRYGVPTRKSLIERTDDIGRYLYLCLEHRKCALCNGRAEVHHVNRVGMGRDREQIVHEGLLAVTLCRTHHDMAHTGEREFFEKHHICGIKLDKYLCKKLSLRARKEEEDVKQSYPYREDGTGSEAGFFGERNQCNQFFIGGGPVF